MRRFAAACLKLGYFLFELIFYVSRYGCAIKDLHGAKIGFARVVERVIAGVGIYGARARETVGRASAEPMEIQCTSELTP